MTVKYALPLLAALTTGTIAGSIPTASAVDYDLDCAVILCLAGGFPSGCGPAKSYMMKRLRRGKSPFGTCSQDDGTPYNNHNVQFSPGSGPNQFMCSRSKNLHVWNAGDDRGSRSDWQGICYTSATRTTSYGRDDNDAIQYNGRSPAFRYDWRVQVTVEPGTPQAFVSDTWYVNLGAGVVRNR